MIVGLGRCTGKLLLGGGAAAPIPDSPMLPGEMPWALLINQHLLSTYYIPATLHLALHLVFSTIPFTDEETEAHRGEGLTQSQPRLSQGQECRGSKGAVEQV